MKEQGVDRWEEDGMLALFCMLSNGPRNTSTNGKIIVRGWRSDDGGDCVGFCSDDQ
jgi:hypothetical protein